MSPAPELQTIDLLHMGRPGAVAAHRFGDVIVDPGAAKTIDRVIDAFGDRIPRAVLLTHVHFDHAGGTGALVRKYPDIEVWVHEIGAPHMIDPTRLVASARRVWLDFFDALWGEVIPVPEQNIRIVRDGDVIADALGEWEVAYTPGHARHHVAYLHRQAATAFTGDVSGIRIEGGPAFPPTPPPDIDPAAWHASLGRVAAWKPERLAFSHFGVADDPVEHLAGMQVALDEFAAAASATDAAGFAAWIRAWLEARGAGDAIDTYYVASPFEGMWGGFDRWRQQQR